MQNFKINSKEFIRYKLANSLFAGLSIGSIFIIYSPLSPSVFSIGGVGLAIFMLIIARLYHKILNIKWFFIISMFVEVVLFIMIVSFIIFGNGYTNALFIYGGYQLTFAFGSYLIRAETLFLKKRFLLSLVDTYKQIGYIIGLIISYLYYMVLEKWFFIVDKIEQVHNIHFLFLIVQIAIIIFLLRAFDSKMK